METLHTKFWIVYILIIYFVEESSTSTLPAADIFPTTTKTNPSNTTTKRNKLTTETITAIAFLGVVAVILLVLVFSYILLHKIRRKIKEVHGHHSEDAAHVNKKVILDNLGPPHTRPCCDKCIPHQLLIDIRHMPKTIYLDTEDYKNKTDLNGPCQRCGSCQSFAGLTKAQSHRKDQKNDSDPCHRCNSSSMLVGLAAELSGNYTNDCCQKCQSVRSFTKSENTKITDKKDLNDSEGKVVFIDIVEPGVTFTKL